PQLYVRYTPWRHTPLCQYLSGMPAPHPLAIAIGAAIRAKREASGYAQDEFAAVIDMDRSYYSHVERGRYNMTAGVLAKITVGLGVELDELLPRLKELRRMQPFPKPTPRTTKTAARRQRRT